MMRPMCVVTLGLLGLACSATNSSSPAQGADGGSMSSSQAGDDEAEGPQPGDEAEGEPNSGTCGVEAQTVKFATSDGVSLEAEFRPSGRAGGKAVVLLHMIPPNNDRSNYTPAFIDALADAGYTVLNVDRRGAGGSEGVATEAYEGPNGRLDAVAAVGFLESSGCAVAPTDVAIVGASNGTTTALDYTAEATEKPAALVFLSPGAYTENQHRVADEAASLAAIPLFVGYPDSEAAWPEGIRRLDQGAWEFHEYRGGQHGTRLFTSSPASVPDIVAFLGRVFPS